MNNKGSITVEACIVFPIVFLCTIIILYLCIILYQQVLLQSLANRALQHGADVCNNYYKDISTGEISKDELEIQQLYSKLIDNKENEKKDKIKRYINNRLIKYSILKPLKEAANEYVYVEVKNYVVYKKLIINIKVPYKIPLGNFFSIFGVNDRFIITAKAENFVDNPSEFIRNTDFLLDLENEFEQKTNINISEKLSDFISNILKFVSKYI